MKKQRYYILSMLIQEGIYINNPHRKGEKNMNTVTKQAIELMEILPESEQNFALEFIKKLVLAWDPDFTKLTSAEQKELEEAKEEIENGETVSHEAINWD